MEDGLLVRVQPLRPLCGAQEVGNRLLTCLAEIEVAGEQVDRVFARAVEGLGDFRDLQVELPASTAQQA